MDKACDWSGEVTWSVFTFFWPRVPGRVHVKMAEGGISDCEISDEELGFDESGTESEEERELLHRGVEGYQFEPEYTEEELAARAAEPDREAEEDDLAAARMQNTDWYMHYE